MESLLRPSPADDAAPTTTTLCLLNGFRWLMPCMCDEPPPTPRERRLSSLPPELSGTVLQLAELRERRGHRFSRDLSEDVALAAAQAAQMVRAPPPPGPISPRMPGPTSPPMSYREEPEEAAAAAPPSFCLPPPADAPHVLVLDPGSGESCAALQSSVHVHLAAAPEYDEQIKRYPPFWKSMVGVRLSEAEAAADAAEPVAKSSWPGVHDLRGPAHPKNLATWASVLYDAKAETVRGVDVTAHGADRTAARGLEPAVLAIRRLRCLVCGSRGGQVLPWPALWQLPRCPLIST